MYVSVSHHFRFHSVTTPAKQLQCIIHHFCHLPTTPHQPISVYSMLIRDQIICSVLLLLFLCHPTAKAPVSTTNQIMRTQCSPYTMWIRFDAHLIHVTAINQRGPQFLAYIKDNLEAVLMWFPSAVTLARISAELNFPQRKGD